MAALDIVALEQDLCSVTNSVPKTPQNASPATDQLSQVSTLYTDLRTTALEFTPLSKPVASIVAACSASSSELIFLRFPNTDTSKNLHEDRTIHEAVQEGFYEQVKAGNTGEMAVKNPTTPRTSILKPTTSPQFGELSNLEAMECQNNGVLDVDTSQSISNQGSDKQTVEEARTTVKQATGSRTFTAALTKLVNFVNTPTEKEKRLSDAKYDYTLSSASFVEVCLNSDDSPIAIPRTMTETVSLLTNSERSTDCLTVTPGDAFVSRQEIVEGLLLGSNVASPPHVHAWVNDLARASHSTKEAPTSSQEPKSSSFGPAASIHLDPHPHLASTPSPPARECAFHVDYFIVKANTTFIGNTSMADFIDELEYDETTGMTTCRHIVGAFISLADTKSTTTAPRRPLDWTSPVDVHRIRLGKISLSEFSQHTGLNSRGIPNAPLSVSAVIAVFEHYAKVDARSGKKLKQLIAAGCTGGVAT
ncbi:hypothetical protein CC80DRAFT_539846 [Byssothecium circinans]|uniref:Uncharacterized protein n=1 Tax=Byssothecium circinans TaxID=147558 RepID=A0A6A5TGP4_9PLEO|nr:hypothetical protein CC80DRAFT_539846 [Byssothecium circinans]